MFRNLHKYTATRKWGDDRCSSGLPFQGDLNSATALSMATVPTRRDGGGGGEVTGSGSICRDPKILILPVSNKTETISSPVSEFFSGSRTYIT